MTAFYRKFLVYAERVFSIDVRALAVLRVGIAILVLADLCRRAQDLRAHYTDEGIWPTEAAVTYLPTILPSIHLLNGSLLYQSILFGFAGISALFLLVGYRTTFFTFTTWFFTLSLQHSNTAIQQGGDWELLLLLFWGMFLPLSATFSVDRATQETMSIPKQIFSLASVALTLQILFVYFFAFFHKSGVAWKTDFNAVQHALQIDQYVTVFGAWLSQFGWLTTGLTLVVLILQILALPAVLAPLRSSFARNTIVILLICTHIGYFFTLHIGLFSFISITGLLVLLSGSFYDKVSKWLYRHEPISIYYDYDCGFCRKSVWLIKTFFLVPTTHIGPAQDNPKVWKTMQEKDSWVVTDTSGTHYTTFQAGVRIARSSGWLSWLVYLAKPRFMQRFGEWFYRVVARNRKSISLPNTRLQKKPKEGFATLKNTFLIWALCTITLVNLNAFTEKDLLPSSLKWQVHYLRLDQPWHVFAPTPRREDGWLIMIATTTTGNTVDALTGKPVSYKKPKDVAKMFPNQRWRKYLTNLPSEGYEPFRQYYMDWVCREWEKEHPGEALIEMTLVYMLEYTYRDASEAAPTPIFLSRYNCATMMERPLPEGVNTRLSEGVSTQEFIDHQE